MEKIEKMVEVKSRLSTLAAPNAPIGLCSIDLDALEQDIQLMREVATIDAGHLAVFDPTPIDTKAYRLVA